jgi:membrane associated rhomboid family serine protease
MLPVREQLAPGLPRRPAYVVWGLVMSNFCAFLAEQAVVLGGDVRFPIEWGLVPRVLTDFDPLHGVLTIFTSMFLHAGWLHLLGNLWFLWFFGRGVEDALGHFRFVVLYLTGGIVAALAQTGVDPNGVIPMLGASGAIGAVLAAYVSLFPTRRIVTVVPIIIIPVLIAIPAFLFVLEWFVMNLLSGFGALTTAMRGGTAWWAHVGGFLSGLFLVRILFPRAARNDFPPPPGGTPPVRVHDLDGRPYTTSDFP